MSDTNRRFEEIALPHLSAAYNLARWLVRNDHDAEDLVQEAYLRALKFFDSFRGEDARAWLLAIVRNTCYTWLKQNRVQELHDSFDEDKHSEADSSADPQVLMLQNASKELLNRGIEALPLEFREILIMRELEDLTYKEIATVANIPIGTVMSRLARARDMLRVSLERIVREEK
ncbi:MAG TPA: sigma-70 family RNA polymerase sigma factor [Burkholderiales bacterium]|nr:sigma-70 family RNA polymerase sigma factor [Burkholderiales bacterium]